MFNGGFGQCEMGIHNHTTGLDHAKNVLVLYLSIVGWVSSFVSLVRAFIVSLFSMFTQLRSFLFVILMLNFKIIRVTLNSVTVGMIDCSAAVIHGVSICSYWEQLCHA